MSKLFLGLLVLIAVLVPEWGPYSFDQQDMLHLLESPSLLHWFGTDALGRDLFTRVMYGTRFSLMIGFTSATLTFMVGLFWGSLAAHFGRFIDPLLMKAIDVIAIFPSTLMAILFSLVFGQGIWGILFALTLTTLTTPARLTRGLTLQIKQEGYVQSALSLGASTPRILLRHVIPNLKEALVSAWLLQISTNIMAESFLSFLGLGVRAPACSWGTLAHEGVGFIQSYPHLLIFPSLVLLLTSLALQNFDR